MNTASPDRAPHGVCECADHCPCARHRHGPVAYIVLRGGRPVRICTSCLLTDDVIQRILATLAELPIYAAYDLTGSRVLARVLHRQATLN